MKKGIFVAALIIIILIGIRFSIVKFSEVARGKALMAARTPEVTLDEISEKEISKAVEIAGRIESVDKVELVARVDGYLQKKHFQEGDFVRKGQTLFTIEQTQYLNILNKAKADLESAKAALYKAERDYQRGAELVKKDFISKSTYDSLYADKLSTAAAVKAASAALAEAKRNYSYTTIKSPVDGKIGSLNIHEGNYVTVATGALATVTKISPIYVKYSIDSKQYEDLKASGFFPKKNEAQTKVEIILPNGKTYTEKGTQDFLDNQISLSTGTIDLRATFKNANGELIPGDFVKVKVYSNKTSIEPVVPQSLTLQDSVGRYVYAVDNDNNVYQKYFKDNGQYGSYWIVEEGLSKGDKFISSSITKLAPKMKVKIVETAPDEENSQEGAK